MKGTVCVLGASGFIGSRVLEYLSAKNIPSFGISRSVENKRIHRISDYGDTRALSVLMKDCSIVINAIGSYKPKDFSSNLDAPFSELGTVAHSIDAAIRGASISRFIHISSAGTVYGSGSSHKHSEEDLAIPITWYGRIKLLEECYYEQLCRRHSIEYVCARVTNPFDNPKRRSHGFVDILAKTISEGEVFHTFNTNFHRRDFIHSMDMARMLSELAFANMSSSKEVFNIGSGQSTSLYELALLVDKRCNNVNFDMTSDTTGVNIVDVCIDKVRQTLNIDWPLVSPEEYLNNVIKKNKGFSL